MVPALAMRFGHHWEYTVSKEKEGTFFPEEKMQRGAGWQPALYDKLNKFSEKHPLLGRVAVILVAPADVLLETLKGPVTIIESIAYLVINLVAAIYHLALSDADSYERSIRSAKVCVASLGYSLISTPVALVKAIPRLIWQIGVIAIDPTRARSINAPSSFKSSSWSSIHDFDEGF